MVGLKVLNDNIVGSAIAKDGLHIIHPLVGLTDIDSVHYCYFFVEDDV